MIDTNTVVRLSGTWAAIVTIVLACACGDKWEEVGHLVIEAGPEQSDLQLIDACEKYPAAVTGRGQVTLTDMHCTRLSVELDLMGIPEVFDVAIDKKIAYVAQGGRGVFAYSLSTGELVWPRPSTDTGMYTVLISRHGDRLLAYEGSAEYLYREMSWPYDKNYAGGESEGTPYRSVSCDDATAHTQFRWIDASTGATIWRSPVQGAFVRHMALNYDSGGRLRSVSKGEALVGTTENIRCEPFTGYVPGHLASVRYRRMAVSDDGLEVLEDIASEDSDIEKIMGLDTSQNRAWDAGLLVNARGQLLSVAHSSSSGSSGWIDTLVGNFSAPYVDVDFADSSGYGVIYPHSAFVDPRGTQLLLPFSELTAQGYGGGVDNDGDVWLTGIAGQRAVEKYRDTLPNGQFIVYDLITDKHQTTYYWMGSSSIRVINDGDWDEVLEVPDSLPGLARFSIDDAGNVAFWMSNGTNLTVYKPSVE